MTNDRSITADSDDSHLRWYGGLFTADEAIRRVVEKVLLDLKDWAGHWPHRHPEHARHYILPQHDATSVVSIYHEWFDGPARCEEVDLRRATAEVLRYAEAVVVVSIQSHRNELLIEIERPDFTVEQGRAEVSDGAVGELTWMPRRELTEEDYPWHERNWERAVSLGFW